MRAFRSSISLCVCATGQALVTLATSNLPVMTSACPCLVTDDDDDYDYYILYCGILKNCNRQSFQRTCHGLVMIMLQDAGSSPSKRKSGKFREEVFMAPVLGLQAPEWCHNWIFLLTCNSNKNFGQVINKSTHNVIPMQWRQVKCPAS